MNTRIVVAAVIAYFSLLSSVHSAQLEIVLPNKANTAWVSNNINQNGMVLSIRTFHSPQSVDDVINFYRTAWFREGEVPGFVENDMAEWKLISQKHKNKNVVLQLKTTDQGGSTGFLSVAQLNRGSSTSIELDFPIPDNTQEFSTTYLEEDDAQVHTMTFITKQTVGTTTKFYEDRLQRKGWAVARSSELNGGQIILFNRRADRCEMVIQKLNEEDTVIYVNRVNRNA